MQQNDTDRRTQDASAYGDPPRCYVITHERSGTHLTINLLIKNSTAELGWRSVGEWHGPFDQPFTAFDHIERFNRADQGPGVVAKTHCDRDLFEKIYKPAPVIYVMRDPRDVMVSWWKSLAGTVASQPRTTPSAVRNSRQYTLASGRPSNRTLSPSSRPA